MFFIVKMYNRNLVHLYKIMIIKLNFIFNIDNKED